jgi:hypothetical protein
LNIDVIVKRQSLPHRFAHLFPDHRRSALRPRRAGQVHINVTNVFLPSPFGVIMAAIVPYGRPSVSTAMMVTASIVSVSVAFQGRSVGYALGILIFVLTTPFIALVHGRRKEKGQPRNQLRHSREIDRVCSRRLTL